MKQVIYNGGRQSYCGCSNPEMLIMGKVYKVLHEDVKEWQTNYILEGVRGEFNSVWFNEVLDIPTHFAISNQIPAVGKRCEFNKLVIDGDIVITQSCVTSTVFGVEPIGKDTYRVITRNSIYLITVM